MPLKNGGRIWREHRTVCLPDFQGVGIGNALSELVAALHKAESQRYRSVTSSPAMITHRARSPLWLMDRKPGMVSPPGKTAKVATLNTRWTASFEYVGPRATPEQVGAFISA
jgi:hypothetical protein